MPSELLKNLMSRAHERRLVLPDFQRDFVWKPSDVVKLLASLLNGYPIGGLLFMENPGMYGHRQLDGVASRGDAPKDTTLILDGQQRLTSCYRVFFGAMEVERYAGRYYFDFSRYLQNPKVPNVEVEELIQFVTSKEVVGASCGPSGITQCPVLAVKRPSTKRRNPTRTGRSCIRATGRRRNRPRPTAEGSESAKNSCETPYQESAV